MFVYMFFLKLAQLFLWFIVTLMNCSNKKKASVPAPAPPPPRLFSSMSVRQVCGEQCEMLLLDSPKTTTSTGETTRSRIAPTYKLYSLRWVILSSCCLLALSNAMQWISYTTLTQELRTFYCEDKLDFNCDPSFISNQIFQGVAVITGIGGMYITDHYGIRISIMSGVTFNIIGSSLRLLSSYPNVAESSTRITLLYIGTTIVAVAQAFFLVLPSKIAECWFPEDQRASANVLSFVTNPAGVALGTLVPSLFFDSAKANEFERSSQKLFVYNLIMFSMCLVTFILTLFIRLSEPPTPPSPSNANHSDTAPPFWEGIAICFRTAQFNVQIFTFALAFAQLWGIMVILPDILMVAGYNLAGYPIVACAVVGGICSIIAGRVADKTKRFKEIIKFCMIVFFVGAILLRLYLLKEVSTGMDSFVILTICALLGAVSVPQFPIGVELGVETTFPVYEATSSGLLVLSSQLWMFIFYYLFEMAKTMNIFYDFDRNSQVGNWKLVLDIWVAISLITAVFTFVFLRPKYNRIKYEEDAKANEKKLINQI